MYYRYNKQRDERGLLHQDVQVLELLLQLKSRAQISEVLGMPRGTVNTSITRIYKVLGCKNIAELIYHYKERGTEA